MLLGVIAACEAGFWVFLVAGLAARYLLRRRRLSAVLLVAAPLVDVVLLVVTGVSLSRGDTAGIGHALAAIYIGFSVAYGHRLLHWADVRFAHRFADGPAPDKPVGPAYTRLCWADVGRTAVAAAIASGLTAILVAAVGHPERTAALESNYGWMALILLLDLLWAVGVTIWPSEGTARSGTDVEPSRG